MENDPKKRINDYCSDYKILPTSPDVHDDLASSLNASVDPVS